MTGKKFEALKELLGDAGKSPRLTNWESGFIASIRRRVDSCGQDTSLSEAQWNTLRQIEEKIYAAG